MLKRPMGRRRFGAATAVSILATVFMVAVAPTPARADVLMPPGDFNCAAYPDIAWQRIFGGFDIWRATRYQLVSASQTFDVADARVVQNALPNDAQATFSSQQSRTFSVTVSIGSTVKVGELVSLTMGVQVVQTQTTAIGVAVTTTVPANTTVLGEYGLHAYDVVFDVQDLYKDNRHCSAITPKRGTGHTPTITEGWRFRQL